MSHGFRLITATIAALGQSLELALDELFAERGDMVDKHLAVQMVELMLHDTGQIALNPFVVVLELLVVPFDMDACGTDHLLVDGG